MKRIEKVSEKEALIYKFIKDSIEMDGYAPSVRDICTALGISSTSTVHTYLHRMESKGLISLSSGKSRALRIHDDHSDSKSETYRVPLLSGISTPNVFAASNVDGYVDFPKVMAKGRSNLFALRISYDTFSGLGILPGDIVIVESGQYHSMGDLVVLHGNNEFEIRKYDEDMLQGKYSGNSSAPLGRVIANFRFY